MLLGRSHLRRVLVIFFDQRDARLRTLKIMNDIEHNLTGYLSIVAIINVAVGICGGAAAWVAGFQILSPGQYSALSSISFPTSAR